MAGSPPGPAPARPAPRGLAAAGPSCHLTPIRAPARDVIYPAATDIRDANAGQTVVIVAGSSPHATHRMAGPVPVSLARYSPVPLVIVPQGPRSGGSGTENSAMPPEVTWFAGSSASLIRAVTGRLSARNVPVNVWMPRSLAAWASMRRSSLASPASRQPGATAMATSAVPSCPALVAGDRDTALAGGFDGDEREPAHVVDGREVIEECWRDLRVAAEEPAADGVGVGGLDRFGQRGTSLGWMGRMRTLRPSRSVTIRRYSCG